MPPKKTRTLDDIVGLFHTPGRHSTIEEMDEAIADAVVERYLRSVEPEQPDGPEEKPPHDKA